MLRNTKSNRKRRVTIWLDPSDLYLGMNDGAGELKSIVRLNWNPDGIPLQEEESHQKLAHALTALAKQYGLHRFQVRLCLDDGLCVTRVATGDKEDVERELENIQVRSQLYLSLGLGDKLTGSLRESADGQSEYALTSIVNLRILKMMQHAMLSAKLRLESIEPVALSITRALGLLGLDQDQPILFASTGRKRCDLAITRSGRLMLSYPISGTGDSLVMAKQVASHMTRLKRFCQRYRLQEGTTLDSIYIFGEPEAISTMAQTLEDASDRIQVKQIEFPEHLQRVRAEAIPNAVLLALWACGNVDRKETNSLGPPDLLEQLAAIELKPLSERLIASFWPTAVAALLMIAVSLAQWSNRQRLTSKMNELSAVTAELSVTEQELAEWDSKEKLLGAFAELENNIVQPIWVELVHDVAPCLPANARLDSFTLSEGAIINLRGNMTEGDRTYEMLAALKQLPQVSEVSVESVTSMGNASLEQFQFEVKCRLNPIKRFPKGNFVGHQNPSDKRDSN